MCEYAGAYTQELNSIQLLCTLSHDTWFSVPAHDTTMHRERVGGEVTGVAQIGLAVLQVSCCFLDDYGRPETVRIS